MTDTHDRDGWHNYCRECNHRYWVRGVDVGKPRMRRYIDRDCTELHTCAGGKSSVTYTTAPPAQGALTL